MSDPPDPKPVKPIDAVAAATSSAQKRRHTNPPDPFNPDPATLRDQWKYATKLYSRWYANAWGTAIFAGLSFFALGWVIKGSNPVHSRQGDSPALSPASADGHER